MATVAHHLRLVSGAGERPHAARGSEPLDLLTLTLLALGLVPFAGLAWWHAWDPRELGVATLMVLFAGRELLRHLVARVRSAARGRSCRSRSPASAPAAGRGRSVAR